MRRAHWLTAGLIAVLLALLALPSLGAGQGSERWTQFHTADGLPSATVWAIAADAGRGDVWLGTSRGASLYRDGRWYSYTQAHGLGEASVMAIAVDPRGRVWFGTYGGGLTVLDGDDWHTYTTANSGLSSDWIGALAVDGLGRIWCGTWGQGLSRFDGEQGWRTYHTGNSLLPADHVTALAAAPDGSLWVGLHGQGVARLAGERWTSFGTAQGLPDEFVEAVAVAPDGTVWVGTAAGLVSLDAQGGHLHTYTTKDGLPDDHIHALALAADGQLWAGTGHGAALLADGRWTAYQGHATLTHDYVSAIAVAPGGVWFGSLSSGVAWYGAGTVASARRPPVVLVHGWHGPDTDRLEDSEFRFLASWLRQDGYPVYYAEGILPSNTVHQNAAQLREVIQRAKEESGAARVDIIAFSMGGLNTRAYLESALYAGDVDQAFILGTPQAGVRTWYPFLLREFHEWQRDPSAVELTPEYAALFNSLHDNSAAVPYFLIVGDARQEELPATLRSLPPGDALISAGSALALDGPAVHKIVTDDLHAWSDETILLGLPSYLWPRRTYDAYIRNRLRHGPLAELPGVRAPEVPELDPPEVPVHSPFYGGEVAPGQTVTHTVTVDTRGEVRFYLRGEAGALTCSLVDPSGRRIDAGSIGERGEHFELGLADFQSYLLRDAQPGTWQVVVGRAESATGATRYAGYAALSSPLRLTVSVDPYPAGRGEPLSITAALSWDGRPVPHARVVAEIGRPDMQVDPLVLLDDGEHGDGAPRDGVYGGTYYPPSLGGYYTVFVTAEGSHLGAAFAHAAERLCAVSPDTASLTGEYAAEGEDANLDGRYDALLLRAGVEVRAAGNYLLAAALADSTGRELGRAVTPVTLETGAQQVPIRFPGQVVARAGVDGPYTISRVTLLDETGAALPLQEAADVLTTRPYRYQDFEGP